MVQPMGVATAGQIQKTSPLLAGPNFLALPKTEKTGGLMLVSSTAGSALFFKGLDMDREIRQRLFWFCNIWDEVKTAEAMCVDEIRNLIQGTNEFDIKRYNNMKRDMGETPEAIRLVFLNGAKTEAELTEPGRFWP
jgi:hypothetical protein